jgi:hypothetical protein
MGWAAVLAAVAIGCGGKATTGRGQTSADQHQPPSDPQQQPAAQSQGVACAGCDVDADGTFMIGGEAERFTVTSRKGSGPGFGGAGMAATGSVDLCGPFAFTGVVDTLVECDESGGIRHARLEGPITSGGGGRFTVNVFDGDQVAPDQFWLFASYATQPFDRFVEQDVSGVQIGDLNQCQEPKCPEGQCLCPEDHVTCEPCASPPPPAPTPPPPPPPPPPPLPQ